jgi:hypothetical protein
MDWKDLLISLYFYVCTAFDEGLMNHTQRHSNNAGYIASGFTDQEAITIYLFGLLQKQRETKGIYQYAVNHLKDWFPSLPSYAKFNERLNWLNSALAALTQYIADRIILPEYLNGQQLVDAVIDSCPIIMAKGSRADRAKVAPEVADKGPCPSKNMWYYGVKLHALGICVPSTLPSPACITLSAASENDNTVFKEQIAPGFCNLRVFGDKIFHDQAGMEELKYKCNIEVMPCNKRKKGQKYLYPDQKLFNTLVSKARQPIESFFNWLEEKTGIQCASKVRSTKGLFKHIFGRLAAALFLMIM